jgi:uncharacterized protein (TIGR01777 family)
LKNSEFIKEGKMSRIIVTGGTGFIGRPLLNALRKAGYETLCLTRHPQRAESMNELGVKFAFWDGKSAEGWKQYVEDAHAVINLAGANISSGRWTKKRKELLRMSRLSSGRAVSEAVLSSNRPPKVVVQASAVGYYGSRGNSDLSETSLPGKGFLSQLCEEWEESSRAVESAGVRYVVIRSGLVLGSSGGALPHFLRMFRFHLGGYLGNGRQWISWIDVGDEIRALLFLLEREDLSGVFNLAAPHPVQMREFSQILGRSLKKSSWFPVPAILLRLLLGTMAKETVLASQKVLPERLLKAGFKFECPYLKQAFMDIF